MTATLAAHPNITIVREEITVLPPSLPLILATGPLTSDALAAEIARLTGGDSLSFYDAVSPTVTYDSLDLSKVFRASRRGKGMGEAGERRKAKGEREEDENTEYRIKNTESDGKRARAPAG